MIIRAAASPRPAATATASARNATSTRGTRWCEAIGGSEDASLPCRRGAPAGRDAVATRLKRCETRCERRPRSPCTGTRRLRAIGATVRGRAPSGSRAAGARSLDVAGAPALRARDGATTRPPAGSTGAAGAAAGAGDPSAGAAVACAGCDAGAAADGAPAAAAGAAAPAGAAAAADAAGAACGAGSPAACGAGSGAACGAGSGAASGGGPGAACGAGAGSAGRKPSGSR
jgi:hypothetical protein